MPSTLDLMNGLLTCESREELQAAGNLCARRFGYDVWVYALMPATGGEMPFLCGSFPHSWYARHFTEGRGIADAVFAYCRQHARPLPWYQEDLLEDDPTCPVFFADAADIGLHHGVSVPLHGFSCPWGLLALASSKPAERRTERRRLADAQLLAAYVHETGHRLSSAIETHGISLTERERQCLRWSAGGKTGWEIGRLLGISERTVVFHLENAARKFGVYGRHQAAARAIAMNMISL